MFANVIKFIPMIMTNYGDGTQLTVNSKIIGKFSENDALVWILCIQYNIW